MVHIQECGHHSSTCSLIWISQGLDPILMALVDMQTCRDISIRVGMGLENAPNVCISPENPIATEAPSGKTACDVCMILKVQS